MNDLTDLIYTKDLPALTQVTLNKLIKKETQIVNVIQLRYNRKRTGVFKDYLELGLAVSAYKDICVVESFKND